MMSSTASTGTSTRKTWPMFRSSLYAGMTTATFIVFAARASPAPLPGAAPATLRAGPSAAGAVFLRDGHALPQPRQGEGDHIGQRHLLLGPVLAPAELHCP